MMRKTIIAAALAVGIAAVGASRAHRRPPRAEVAAPRLSDAPASSS